MSDLRRFLPANVGAEPKKLAILGVLAAALVFVFFMNSGSDVPQSSKGKTQTTLPKAGDFASGVNTPLRPIAPRTVARTGPRAGANEEWVPSLKVDDDFDLSQVDPTLQFEKLEKVRAVGPVGGRRSLFEFYTPPPPPPPPVTVNPNPITPPPPPTTTQNTKAAPPPPPPIPLKFYGYEGRQRDTNRRAFFIDGDEIFLVRENELIRDRYKIIRLNLTSAEVEDTVAKNRQTLPLLDPVERP